MHLTQSRSPDGATSPERKQAGLPIAQWWQFRSYSNQFTIYCITQSLSKSRSVHFLCCLRVAIYAANISFRHDRVYSVCTNEVNGRPRRTTRICRVLNNSRWKERGQCCGEWVSEWAGFNGPLDTHRMMSETSLSIRCLLTNTLTQQPIEMQRQKCPNNQLQQRNFCSI